MVQSKGGGMLEEKVFEIFSKVMNFPKEKLNLKTKIEEVENWDSVQHLNLILAIEEEFNVKFNPDEIQEMLSIEKILSNLKNKTI